ncbi:hypothetical protein K439DRAFT_1317798, partial [Ramaria rubella]
IVDEVTTLQWHIEANHQGAHGKWVPETPGTENKLPKHLNLEQLRMEGTRVTNDLPQSALTDHFGPAPPAGIVIPYSDERFKQASEGWFWGDLMPIQALEHPKFVEMIDVAAWAKNGV